MSFLLHNHEEQTFRNGVRCGSLIVTTERCFIHPDQDDFVLFARPREVNRDHNARSARSTARSDGLMSVYFKAGGDRVENFTTNIQPHVVVLSEDKDDELANGGCLLAYWFDEVVHQEFGSLHNYARVLRGNLRVDSPVRLVRFDGKHQFEKATSVIDVQRGSSTTRYVLAHALSEEWHGVPVVDVTEGEVLIGVVVRTGLFPIMVGMESLPLNRTRPRSFRPPVLRGEDSRMDTIRRQVQRGLGFGDDLDMV